MGSTIGARRRVLDEALQCFINEGYEATTIALIVERSGVSNGALFHHFPSKEAIADALYREAIVSFQQGLWNLLLGRPRNLRAAVRGTIEHQLRWTEENPDDARFVYMRGHLDWNSPVRKELAGRNRELAETFEALLQPLVESGEVRESSMLVITAIVSGPAHAIARRWLAGYLDRSPTDYLDELADAALAGIRGHPGRHRSAVAHSARSAHLTFELLDEHGEISARGETSAELAPLDGAARELAALGPADL